MILWVVSFKIVSKIEFNNKLINYQIIPLIYFKLIVMSRMLVLISVNVYVVCFTECGP